MPPTVKATCVKLSILLLLCQCVTSFIIPEDIPTLLSLVYSNIPPVKKGTDSRLGIGFRLGEHADFQVMVELGPQMATRPIGGEDDSNKIKRAAMVSAAMRGEYGPWTQALTKYQVEQRLRKELQKLKAIKAKAASSKQPAKSNEPKTDASNWLLKWSKQAQGQYEEESQPVRKPMPTNRLRVVDSKIDEIKMAEIANKDSQEQLERLKVLYDS